MDTEFRWVSRRETRQAAALITLRLTNESSIARFRAALSVLLVPHLMATDGSAVIGLRPVHMGARLLCCMMNALTAALPGHQKPLGLHVRSDEWRVVNFSAPAGDRRVPGSAMHLARALLQVADSRGIRLNALARLDDPRLVPAYQQHGFMPVSGPDLHNGVQEMTRAPVGVRGEQALSSAIKAHYEAFPFIQGGRARERHWSQRLRAHLPSDCRLDVLDIGCGSGETTGWLVGEGARLTFLDLTSNAVRSVRERGHTRTVQATALALPFPDEAFDAAVSIGVLHHTGDWQAALAECSRVVRTGGSLVVMIYARWTPYHLAYLLTEPLRRNVPGEAILRIPSAALIPMRVAIRLQGRPWLHEEQVRRLIADQLWTPSAMFVTYRQFLRIAEANYLSPETRTHLPFHAHLVGFQKRASAPAAL